MDRFIFWCKIVTSDIGVFHLIKNRLFAKGILFLSFNYPLYLEVLINPNVLSFNCLFSRVLITPYVVSFNYPLCREFELPLMW